MSDPAGPLCEIKDSFSRSEPKYVKTLDLSLIEKPILVSNFISGADVVNPPPIYADKDSYERLTRLKDSFEQYPGPTYVEARDKTNPTEYLGRSIFQNRAAIKFANIDGTFQLSYKSEGLRRLQFDDKFTFCDIASGPGGFTEYLQWRQTQSTGFGMTLHGNLDFDTRKLDMTRFTPLYGPDNTGDLLINWEWFVDKTLERYTGGVDLVMADGGFEVAGEEYRQEWLSSRLMTVQILVGLKATKVGGNFVMKVFDTVTEISANLIYILGLSFKEITMFKPLSSRPANSERYIVCREKKGDRTVDPYYIFLKRAFTQMPLVKMFDKMSPKFIKWLKEGNKESIELQTDYCQAILSYLQGNKKEIMARIPKYNLRKMLMLWNLPGNPDESDDRRPRRS